MLGNYLKKKNMSVYRFSKLSGVPYATLNELCNNKTSLEKCNAGTLYRICKTLGVSMEEMLEQSMDPRIDFENYKSNICQAVKRNEEQFVIDTIKDKTIVKYWERTWYPEALYLLAMLDYICRKRGLPLCETYESLRYKKLEQPIYPQSVLALSLVVGDRALEEARKSAIPEFMRHNIVEGEVESVA